MRCRGVIDAHLKKLRKRDEISPAEEQAIRGAIGEVKTVPADHLLIERGVELSVSTLLIDGMLCRFKDVRSGERQITELHLAGDFADLHSFTLKRLDHDIMSLTPCRVAMVPHERLREITERHPHLTRVYWFMTNLDAAIQREWTLSMGRRPAIARIAHLLCELYVRLEIVGLTRGLSFDCPLTQTDIAECVGLTSVHVNRTLQVLRRRKLIEFKRGQVTISDWDGLRGVAEFNADYLYLERKPR